MAVWQHQIPSECTLCPSSYPTPRSLFCRRHYMSIHARTYKKQCSILCKGKELETNQMSINRGWVNILRYIHQWYSLGWKGIKMKSVLRRYYGMICKIHCWVEKVRCRTVRCALRLWHVFSDVIGALRTKFYPCEWGEESGHSYCPHA